MHINAMSKRRIAKSFSPYVPIIGVALLFYSLVLGVIIFWLCNKYFNFKVGFGVVMITSTMLITFFMCLYCNWVVTLINSSYVNITDREIDIKAPHGFGASSHKFKLGYVEAIVFGQPLNWAEIILADLHDKGVPKLKNAALVRDIKSGKLMVISCDGRKKTYNFIDKAFEYSDLEKLFHELKNRGVTVIVS